MTTNTNFNNLWSFYQKFLVFEEPLLKWTNIVKSGKRLDAQYFQTHLDAFNSSCELSATRLINVLIAFSEATSFAAAALDKLLSVEIVQNVPAARVAYWQKTANTNISVARLMTLAEIFAPDWQHVISQMSLSDSRMHFIRDCLEPCQSTVHKLDNEWQRTIEVFTQCLKRHRATLPGNFLPHAIILVEGPTEVVLLPYFAQTYGIDLSSSGTFIVPAGGANQIARKYFHWSATVHLPIFCLFDHDALTIAQTLSPQLRKGDCLYVLADGEIEDIVALNILVAQINHYLSYDPLHDISKPILVTDFDSAEKRTLILEKIWQKMELGKFEKVKFAQFFARQSPKQYTQELLTADGKQMLEKLTELISRSLAIEKIDKSIPL